jgi:Ras-related protein Rab-7A
MEYKFKLIVLGDYSCGKTSLLNRLTNDEFNYNYNSTIGVDYFVKKYYESELFDEDVVILEEVPSFKDKNNVSRFGFPSGKNKSEIKIYSNKNNVDKKTIDKMKSSQMKKYLKVKTQTNDDNILYDLRIWDTSGQERFSKLISSYYKNLSAAIIMFDITNIRSFHSVNSWHKQLFENLNEQNKNHFPIVIVGNKSDCKNHRSIDYEDAIKLAEKLNCLYVETSVKDDVNIKSVFEKIIEKLVFNIDTQLITPGIHNGIQIYHKSILLEFQENDQLLEEKESDKRCCLIM